MLVKIHGTSGAGKTTLMREILRRLDFKPGGLDLKARAKFYIAEPDSLSLLHNRYRRVVVLGRYEEGVGTGGLDTINSAAARLALIEPYCHPRHKDASRVRRTDSAAAVSCR
jgi:molybdopterin-guanine dinucleotide biosynthesis protein